MSRPQQRRNNQGRRPPAKRPAPIDVWRNPGTLPEIEPIVAATEAGALLRSLGDPPMIDGSTATKYFTVVVQRAAAIAAALALSADLLAPSDDD
jgi:hypothetical protein